MGKDCKYYVVLSIFPDALIKTVRFRCRKRYSGSYDLAVRINVRAELCPRALCFKQQESD